jgi:hypothetical protein
MPWTYATDAGREAEADATTYEENGLPAVNPDAAPDDINLLTAEPQ